MLKSLIPLNLVLVSASFALDAKILYFNPASTTTIDGKFTLVAVREKIKERNAQGREVERDGIFYRYARPKKGSATELRLVSGRVFGAFEDGPDPRGYGPSLTRTSRRYDGVNPEVTGELIATQFQARKWSGIVVHKYNKNKGIYEQNREINRILKETGAKAEKEMIDGIKAALGNDYESKYHSFHEWGGTSLIEKRYNTQTDKEEWTWAESTSFNPATVDEGLGIDISNSIYLSPKEENSGLEEHAASYTVQIVLTMGPDGKINVTEISRTIEVPKAISAALAIPARERILNQEARKILQERIVEPENEGEVEAIPAAEQ